MSSEVPIDWTQQPLEYLCSRVSVGYVGETSSHYTDDKGIALLRSQNVRPNRLDLSEVRHITRAFHAQSKKSQLQAGDLLIVRVGQNRGDCAVMPQGLGEVNCANIVFARPAESYSNFLGAYFNTPQGHSALLSVSSGSAQLVLNTTAVAKIEVPVPPPNEAHAIGTLSRAFEDRIALLCETNATLEAIAQALFKSWFVDFDPVRAKMEGRVPEGMDEATAAVFPDGLEESELGLVPRGWRVRALDEVANYLNGLALQKFPPTDDSWLPVIKIAQLRKGDTVGADRAGRNLKPEYVIQNGDVLFSWSGSLEVEVWCGGEGALNQHLFKVTSDRYPKWFYYFWTKHHLENFRQIAASKATTMGHIQRAHLSQAKVVAPPDGFVSAVGEYFAPLLDRWISTALQAQTLATLRDTLLPRLISGQLRLPEADAAAEDALA